MYGKTLKSKLRYITVLFLASMFSSVYAVELVKDIYEGQYSGSPIWITDVNGTAFFLGISGGIYGDEEYALWRSDGTEAGTQFIKDLDNPERSFTYEEFTAFNGALFFRGNADTGGGAELWKSDGTAIGTQMVRDIYPGDDSGYPESLSVYGNTLMFLATTEDYGKELWRSDGTALGTYMIRDIHEGTASIDADSVSHRTFNYAVSNNIFYFTAIAYPYWVGENYIGGYELWRSDGTGAGTYMIRDLTPFNAIPYGPASTNPGNLTDLDGTLIFSATQATPDYSTGEELFRSNGTSGGTVLVKDINPEGSSYPSHFVKVDRHFIEVDGQLIEVEAKIFFLADDGVHGRELWVTNGTALGTYMVIDLVPGEAGVWTTPSYGVSNRENPLLEQMTAFDGRLFFRFNDGEYNHGFELWVSDGSAIGTHLFKDIGTGEDLFGYAASGYPDELTVVGSHMYFSAWDSVYQRELWQTDGTVIGTRMVADMANDSYWHSSNPTQLANVNGNLFFNAANYNYRGYPNDIGYELWKLGVFNICDYNQDGINDILIRNTATGATYVWLMNSDGSRGSVVHISTIPVTEWNIEGNGDYNGDGITDIIVRNKISGATYTWLMNSDGTRAGYQHLATIPESDWEIAGTRSDFNKDGVNDIVVRNKTNGYTFAWLMKNDGTREGYALLAVIPASDWQIAGTGSDFNKDGISDIVVRNKTYGWTYVWLMNSDGTRASYKYITSLPETQWEIAGTDSDFNRDGVSDIVVRNKTYGWTYIWIMNSDGTRNSYKYITNLPFSEWEIAGTDADFNHDGTSDLVVRKKSTGQTFTWLMNSDGSRASYNVITNIPSSAWEIVGTNYDFNQDGISDLMVRNTATGVTYSWLMNASGGRSSTVVIATISFGDWVIVYCYQ